jgi:hypothetical protein
MLKAGEYIQENDERSYYTSEGICGGLLTWEQVPPWMIGRAVHSESEAMGVRRLASSFDELTEFDWLQIDSAASGCIDGTSAKWPALRAAIEKITGKTLAWDRSASWLQGFCEGVTIQAGRDAN